MSNGADAEKMAEWQATRAPGPNHELLKKFVGTWTAEMSMRMAADQPEMKSTGTMTAELMYGGRYLKAEDAGEFMGSSFHDSGLIGYDNFKQKFTAYWIFDSGTQSSFVYGTSTEDGKMIVFHGTTDEAMTGRRDVPMRLIYHFKDDNTIVFEIWTELGLPNEFKSLEITYHRK